MRRIVLILFLSIDLSFCTKEDFYIKLLFYEAPCLNPWGYHSNIGSIKTFLKSKDINPIKVYRERVYPPDTNFCAACFCPTGWAIFIIVLPEDEKKALELGFKKANR